MGSGCVVDFMNKDDITALNNLKYLLRMREKLDLLTHCEGVHYITGWDELYSRMKEELDVFILSKCKELGIFSSSERDKIFEVKLK